MAHVPARAYRDAMPTSRPHRRRNTALAPAPPPETHATAPDDRINNNLTRPAAAAQARSTSGGRTALARAPAMAATNANAANAAAAAAAAVAAATAAAATAVGAPCPVTTARGGRKNDGGSLAGDAMVPLLVPPHPGRSTLPYTQDVLAQAHNDYATAHKAILAASSSATDLYHHHLQQQQDLHQQQQEQQQQQQLVQSQQNQQHQLRQQHPLLHQQLSRSMEHLQQGSSQIHLQPALVQSRQPVTSQQLQFSSEQLHQMHQFRQLEQHRLQQQQDQPEQLQQEQQQQQKHQEQMQDRQQQSNTHGFDPASSVLAHQQHFLDASPAMHDQHGVGNVAAAVAAAAAAAAALAPYSIPQAIAGGTQLPQIPHQTTHQHLSAHHQQGLPMAPISSSGTTMLSLSNPGLSAAHQAHITAGVLSDPAVSHMLNMGMIMTPSGLVPSNYFFPSSMALSQSGMQSSNNPSPWKPPSVPDVQMASAYRIGRYTPAERRIRLERYREKRTQRNYNRRVKYSCRKDIADKRHRVQGRFVKRETEAVLAAQEKQTSVGLNGQNRMADGGRNTNIAGRALGFVGIGKLSSHGSGASILTPGAAGCSSASSDPDFGNIGDDEETL